MTTIRELRARELSVPFKTTFKHAAAERARTSAVWVEVLAATGVIGRGEGCPRSYVTGESVAGALAFIGAHEADLRRRIDSVSSLHRWMAVHRNEIDRHPAAWCAVELALLDVLAKEHGQSVDALLGCDVPQGPFRFTAVLGDSSPDAFAATANRYLTLGFSDFKVKLSGDLAADCVKLDVLRKLDVAGLRVRVDANNLWTDADQALEFLRNLQYPLFAVEEPIGAQRYEDLARIGAELGCAIVLDESLARVEQLSELPGPSTRWVPNVRVSKMGGLLRSLDVVREARARSMGVIVGAQVGETSLLTRVGLSVASAAGADLLAHEGAFGTYLLQYDVCEPPLMFGAGGVLTPSEAMLQGPGFGLQILDERVPGSMPN